MKKMTVIICVLAALALLAVLACSEDIVVRKYTVKTDKIKDKIRIVHISDLHSSDYGEGGGELISEVEALKPDLLVFTGDIYDDRVSGDNATEVMEYFGKKYPCYYVSGNHEVATKKVEKIKTALRSFGITVLCGEMAEFKKGNDVLTVCGIDDPLDAPDKKGRMWEEQLADCNEYAKGESFSLLLAHRPEDFDAYCETDFDLVLAGHAHGGQVRIPGIIEGLYAPNQGYFPKYAGGRYDSGELSMIVSRGLSKYVRPRVFNRPEIVVVDIVGK